MDKLGDLFGTDGFCVGETILAPGCSRVVNRVFFCSDKTSSQSGYSQSLGEFVSQSGFGASLRIDKKRL